ncbi:MAG: cupin domain-containing protein, partial [Burkholderiales bacterium]
MNADPNKAPPPAGQPRLVRAGSSHGGAPVPVGPDQWMVNVPAAATEGALSVMTWHGHAPGGPPLHLHPEQDEVFIVDEGEYRFQCDEVQSLLKAGDSIFLPRGLPHTFRQLSATG